MTKSKTVIYHIAEPAALESARVTGLYSHTSLTSEGFIHCCLKEQLVGVVERYFSDTRGIELFTIDPENLMPELVYENTVGGEELFPHVYGEINMDSVVGISLLDDSLD